MTAKLIPIECEASVRGFDSLIEELQRRNDEGLISSMFVALVERDGTCHSLHTSIPSVGTLLGAIERGKIRIILDTEE